MQTPWHLEPFCSKHRRKTNRGVGSLEANKVYVGNLERNVTEDDAESPAEHFSGAARQVPGLGF